MTTNRRGSAKVQQRVLVVDDEKDIRALFEMSLARMGLTADSAADLAEAKALLNSGTQYHLCLTDMRLPDGDGLDLVRMINTTWPQIPVAVITAFGNMDNAVVALKSGAFDYISKPVSMEQLRALVRSALQMPKSAASGNENIAQDTLLGESVLMQQARDMMIRVARSHAPIYISGESGSGKELAARLIHQKSTRAEGPFVPVNCGSIPENLMESEFFGYRKGAFTGADKDSEGFFQAANQGTLFLDEVADLPLGMQVKLLRVIQERRLRKVGSTEETAVDVRIVCATHQDLKRLVENGQFRLDLYYRLNVIEICMPSLRAIPEDIPLLANHILAKLARPLGRPPPKISADALMQLQSHPFHGNVRELGNILERALALQSGDEIAHADLKLTTLPTSSSVPSKESKNFIEADVVPVTAEVSLQELMDQTEREAIQSALEKTRYNHTAAARLLGVTFRSLRYRMARLGMKE